MSGILTVTILFLIGAIASAIVGAMGKCPWWVSTFCLCVVVALMVLPK
jgi:hypothetical protein